MRHLTFIYDIYNKLTKHFLVSLMLRKIFFFYKFIHLYLRKLMRQNIINYTRVTSIIIGYGSIYAEDLHRCYETDQSQSFHCSEE